MTHELTMKQHSEEKIRKKKTIALKSTAQEEEANLYLMAYENEITPETQNDFIYDELLEAFHELLNNLKELKIKNKNLKSRNQVLAKEKEEVDKKNEKLELKNQSLIKEKDELFSQDRKSTRLNSSHSGESRMPSSA